jgi:cell wall-associated NlpC family hydrolase
MRFPSLPLLNVRPWLFDRPAGPIGNAAATFAERLIGIPYVWGGSSPNTGFDCSGLTMFIYAQLGIPLPHYAAAQWNVGRRIRPGQLEPGDLVFFEPRFDGPGHVGIYIGHGEFIAAPHTGAVVSIGSLADVSAAIGFVGAVRPYAAEDADLTHEARALAHQSQRRAQPPSRDGIKVFVM